MKGGINMAEYGVLIRNAKRNNVYEPKIVVFEGYDKCLKFEKRIRFLDSIVDNEKYKIEVDKIIANSVVVLNVEEAENIELVNECPILVQYF